METVESNSIIYQVRYTMQDIIKWEWLESLNDLYSLSIEGQKTLDFEVIAHCKWLSEISLFECGLKDFEFASKMKNLKSLTVSGTPSADFSTLSATKGLKSLCLPNNGLSDIGFISNLSDLCYLDLKYNNIANISRLKFLKSCDRIFLDHNLVENISVFSEFPFCCGELSIKDNRIKDISPILKKDTISTLYIQQNYLSKHDKQLLASEFAQNRMCLEV